MTQILSPAAPVAQNADGSAVCRHRDLSVCPECALQDPYYVEIAGAHWWVPDPVERRALRAEVGLCNAHEAGDPTCGEFPGVCP